MALTEEQREIALEAWREVHGFEAVQMQEQLFEVIERFLAALPKPDDVRREQNWNMRTEAPIDQPASKCQCRMTTKLVGDGCVHCNPEYAADNEAKPASAPSEQKLVALPFAIFDQEMADLRRFYECAMDNEGYDVPKDHMKRLAEIGLVRRVSANYYEHTNFGLSVLDGDFDTSPQPDYKAQRDALMEVLNKARNALVQWHVPENRYSAIESIDAAIASVKGGE